MAAIGKPLVLVLESGRPLDIRWEKNMRLPSCRLGISATESGNAIADILFGDSSPSARLPITWPQMVGQTPIYYNHKSTGRPTSPDRWHTGYQYDSNDPLFPFGYGLTFTTFKYDNLRVLTPKIAASGTLRVSAEIHNSGSRPGTEVVQLYSVLPGGAHLAAGAGAEGNFACHPGSRREQDGSVHGESMTGFLGPRHDRKMSWVVPTGTYDVWVAPNAMEGIQGAFEIAGK